MEHVTYFKLRVQEHAPTLAYKHNIIPITYRISEFSFKINMFYVLLKIRGNVLLLWKVRWKTARFDLTNLPPRLQLIAAILSKHKSAAERLFSPRLSAVFQKFPLVLMGTLLRNWLQVKSSKKCISIYQQFKVHEASAFLSIVLDIWSPQPALDIDMDTSCHPENRKFVNKFVCPSLSTLTKEEQQKV